MWIAAIVGIGVVSVVTYIVIIGIGMLEEANPSDARMQPPPTKHSNTPTASVDEQQGQTAEHDAGKPRR